jgi:hypothetical protein
VHGEKGVAWLLTLPHLLEKYATQWELNLVQPEVGAFIRNPMPELMTLSNVKNILQSRIDLFSEVLGFEKKRVWAWSFSQSVLAAGWLFEDHQKGWESWITLAEMLLTMEKKCFK